MSDTDVGRLLVASLHQGISDLLPARLEFYESWLNPSGLRDGRIGHAPLAAVLSFLRQEGEAYEHIAARAGEYTGEWTVADLPAVRRAVIRALPVPVRLRLALAVARRMVRGTFAPSRAAVRVRGRRGVLTIRKSVFCEVRDRVNQPLCAFYVAAVRTVTHGLGLDTEVAVERCLATGAGPCTLSVVAPSNAP